MIRSIGTVLALVMAFTGSAAFAQQAPIKGLRGVGINSAIMWSANSTQSPSNPNSIIKHLKPLEGYGFSHVALVSCADWIMGKRCKKGFQTQAGIIKAVRIIVGGTRLHVTLSLKGYEEKKVKGKTTATLQRRLEGDVKIQAAFVAAWRDIAFALKDVPRSRLSFNLLNEPEFQFPKLTTAKRKAWESLASRAIAEIRAISPARVIVFEGVGKSKFNERWKKSGQYKFSVDTILRPLPFKDIVYGVHSYDPQDFLQQANNRVGHFGKAYTSKHAGMVKKDGSRLASWARKHRVPVMVTETGCVSYVEGREGPSGPQECGKYAADAYKAYVRKGIAIVWWGLEKEKSIYIRQGSDCRSGQKKYCDVWVPRSKSPDPFLFKGLNLRVR